MPDHATGASRSPLTRPSRAVHTGWVATRATEAATVVYERLEIQAAKWAPSSSPAAPAQPWSRHPRRG